MSEASNAHASARDAMGRSTVLPPSSATPENRTRKGRARRVEIQLHYEAFAREYVKTRNGTAAVLAAWGLKSDAATSRQATRVLADPWVKQRIAELERVAQERHRIEIDRLMQELGRVAFADPRQLFDEQGQLRHPKDWPDEFAAAVSSIEFDQEVLPDGRAVISRVKIRMHPKSAALELAAKVLGLLRNDPREGDRSWVKEFFDRLKAAGRPLPVAYRVPRPVPSGTTGQSPDCEDATAPTRVSQPPTQPNLGTQAAPSRIRVPIRRSRLHATARK